MCPTSGNIAVVLIRVEQLEELRVVETYAVFLKAMLSNASRKKRPPPHGLGLKDRVAHRAHAKMTDFHTRCLANSKPPFYA